MSTQWPLKLDVGDKIIYIPKDNEIRTGEVTHVQRMAGRKDYIYHVMYYEPNPGAAVFYTMHMEHEHRLMPYTASVEYHIRFGKSYRESELAKLPHVRGC